MDARCAGVHAEDNRSVANCHGPRTRPVAASLPCRCLRPMRGGRRKAGPLMVLGPEPLGDVTTIVVDEPALAESARAIEGRSLGRIAWNRLKRDRVAMAGGAVVILLILIAIFSQLIIKYLGHPPNAFNQE